MRSSLLTDVSGMWESGAAQVALPGKTELPEIDQKQGEPTYKSYERSLQILGKERTNPTEGPYKSQRGCLHILQILLMGIQHSSCQIS